MSGQTNPSRNTLRPWFIWGLAAFFYFAHYVVRVTPGQIIEELQAYFLNTTKYDIGILGASFYLPYVLMQMPVGYLVDKFGSRLLLTIAVIICSLSCFIFANASEFSTALLSRILLGFCSATAFIGALKLITQWFKPKQLALLVGITQALGMLGASAGTAFVPLLNDAIGWHNTFYVYAVVFLILSFFIYAIVKNHPQDQAPEHVSSTPQPVPLFGISEVLSNKYTWINALYAGFIYAPTDALGELWGREFLRNIHQTEPHHASFAISLLFIGWAIGGPIAGWLADRVGRRPVMLYSAIIGAVILPLLFYVPHIPNSIIMMLLFLFGFTNTGLIASYTAAGELHAKGHAGFSMAIANMFSVLLGALLMPLLGWLLEWNSTHGVEGITTYSVADYQRATIILPVCMVLAIVCAFLTKETLLPDTKKQI